MQFAFDSAQIRCTIDEGSGIGITEGEKTSVTFHLFGLGQFSGVVGAFSSKTMVKYWWV